MSIQPLGNLQVAAFGPNSVTPPGKNESAIVSKPSGVEQSIAEPTRQPQSVSREQTEDAVKRLKEFVQPINDSIQFSLDDDTGFTVVKVVDLQTQEVLRQIPSEEAISIAKALDKLKGLLIQSKA